MKIVLNPAYKHLQAFIEAIPENFETDGEIVQDKRNTIKAIEKEGKTFIVKRFRIPIPLNRFIYTFIRESKAHRSYCNSMEIRKRGFISPEPVAFIEEFQQGMLHYSYYICLQSPFTQEIREYYHGPLKGNEDLIKAFAQYTAKLHEAGIYHQDYSPGNILIGKDKTGYLFSLVDTNRMKFKPVSPKEGYHNFERLFGDDNIYRFLAKEYAKNRHLDEAESQERIIHYKNQFLKKDNRKAQMKTLVKNKK